MSGDGRSSLFLHMYTEYRLSNERKDRGKMIQANYECDLHTHTTRSDGADTPEEVIRRAAGLGMKVLALTDHDIVPKDGYTDEHGRPGSLTGYAASLGITLLLGTEISCDTEVEDVHIICLGCDWKDAWFEGLEDEVAVSRVEGYKKLVERLREDGMEMSWEEVLFNSGQPIEERHVLKKMIFELMAQKGYANSWGEAKMLVKNTKRYQIKRRKPDPKNVIREVHRTGGIAILAHPFLISDEVVKDGRAMDRKSYIDELVEAGLDGIEACYTYDKTSYDGPLTKEEIEAYIRENYEKKVKIMSGGSDYHGDQKKGVPNPREIGECGITETYFNLIKEGANWI